MINEIEWIYLIDDRSSSFLVFENNNKSLKNNKIPLLHFLFGLQTLASNNNKDEIKFIKINSASYYIIEENKSKSFFILKSANQIKQKRIFQVLKEIVRIFTINFNGTVMISLPQKHKLFNSFKKEIKTLLMQN
jgi:hypothetical protein